MPSTSAQEKAKSSKPQKSSRKVYNHEEENDPKISRLSVNSAKEVENYGTIQQWPEGGRYS